MRKLTERHEAAYTFIADRLRSTAIAPTYRELGRHLGGISTSHVGKILDALVRRGRLRRLPNRHRAIEVIERRQYFRFDDETKQLVEWRP